MNLYLTYNIKCTVMSSNSDTDVVLRGVVHGAVDYLLKPVNIKELRNIWQHVVRQRTSDETTGVAGQGGGNETGMTDGKKRKDVVSGASGDTEGRGQKKQRVVWNPELHQKFVNAVNQLGIDSKYILRLCLFH